MGRLPTKSDFPAEVKLNIVPPVPKDPLTNILILLHGLGDTPEPFTQLATQLRLPETAYVIPQAPAPLLDLGGFHWGDDILFDSRSGGLDADAGFTASTKLLRTLVFDVLISKCGYAAREILIFGFGQGGMVGLQFATTITESEKGKGGEELVLGGVVSIGAPLPGSAAGEREPKARTPVLVCAGAVEGSSVTSGEEERLRRVVGPVEVVRYRRSGDGMPRDREEMLPIMRFFARRLRSVKGVPEGSVEIG